MLIFIIDVVMLNHLYPQIVAEYVKELDSSYRQKDPLTATRGPMHEYLRMTINFRIKRRHMFSQHDAIIKFSMSLPKDLREPCKPAPAPDNLLKKDANAEKMNENQME